MRSTALSASRLCSSGSVACLIGLPRALPSPRLTPSCCLYDALVSLSVRYDVTLRRQPYLRAYMTCSASRASVRGLTSRAR